MFDIKTQRIEWEIPEEDIPEGSYELVLGVSSESVDISAVDSISFDIVYGNKTDRSRPSGVIPHSTLKDFFSINIVKDSNGESTDSDPVLDESGNHTRTSTNATSGSSQEQFTRGELYPRIKDYHGRGTFFASVSQNQGLEDELIVTFDGITLTMYRVFGIWSFYSELAIGFQAEVVERTFGSRDRREKMSILTVTVSDSNEISLKAMSTPLPKESRFLGLSQASFDGHYYLVVAVSTLLLVWKIPTSLDSEYNLLFVEGIEARTTEETTFGTIDNIDDTETRTAWSICRHQKLYRFDSSTNTFSARNLLDPYRFHPRAFASGILRLTEIFKNADDMSKQSILRYVERNINQYLGPKDASAAVLTHLCRSWTTESHECIHAFIKALLAQPTFRWIPIRSIGRDTNLISTLFGHLEPHLAVLDIVKVMIDYCIRQAKVDGDLFYYTANPQDVRDYRLKTQSLRDKAASVALPIDHDLQGDELAHKAPTELSGMTSPDQHVSQQQQQLWVDQLNEDMRAEFKEELKKQLEAQLNEIMAALRSRDGSNAQSGA
ncbi:hypothetical protein BGX33_004474 [Mortierella sp. NVP41]|nr:hypothetical protein BGX33_004474 [Mortierella sp. NVP41]